MKKIVFSSSVSFILLAACQAQKPDSMLDSATVPGSISGSLSLGQAYDTDRAQWGNLSCITGTPATADLNKSGEIEFTRDLSFDSTLRLLTGNASVGLSFPSTAVDAQAEYAAQNAATDYRETYTLSYRYGSTRKLDLGSLRPSALGLKYAKLGADKLRERCKDEFVNEIDYGLLYVAGLSVEYKSKEDKQTYGGGIQIDAATGGIALNGKLQGANQEVKRGIKIKLHAMQKGGRPQDLAAQLNSNVVSCDAANIKPCLEGFQHLMGYARELADQVKVDSDMAVLAYRTEPYGDSGLDELVGTEEDVDENTFSLRVQLEDSLKRSRYMSQRIQFLLQNYAASYTFRDQTFLEGAKARLQKDKLLLSQALDVCYKNLEVDIHSDFQISKCQQAYNNALDQTQSRVPPNALEVPKPGVPLDFDEHNGKK